eukprot:TRINITY_DN4410_c0_g2_i1.p1 TRINITY_DN4410_c0_g2~~TRINITY_DN4410_c0_g2_i1.p1  ORF type:complete len:496 (+),score=119.95 TRINITY_DN4410_c0_g2_i1:54-1541(+)
MAPREFNGGGGGGSSARGSGGASAAAAVAAAAVIVASHPPAPTASASSARGSRRLPRGHPLPGASSLGASGYSTIVADVASTAPAAEPLLRVAAFGKRPREVPAAPAADAPCETCEALKRRCAMLEASIAEAEAAENARRLRQRSSEVQTDPPAAGVDTGVQAGQVLSSRCCQTDAEPAPSPTATADAGQQAGTTQLAAPSSVATQTRPPARRVAATQTMAQAVARTRDVGLTVVLEDERHAEERRALLAKIDVLLDGSQQLQRQCASLESDKVAIQTQLERLLCEFSAAGKTNSTHGRCIGGERLPPGAQALWTEFGRGPLEAEELQRRCAAAAASASAVAGAPGSTLDVLAQGSCAYPSTPPRSRRSARAIMEGSSLSPRSATRGLGAISAGAVGQLQQKGASAAGGISAMGASTASTSATLAALAGEAVADVVTDAAHLACGGSAASAAPPARLMLPPAAGRRPPRPHLSGGGSALAAHTGEQKLLRMRRSL